MREDLRFDIAAFSDAVKEYQDLIEDMEKVQKTLEQELLELKNTYWKSEAGEKFQKQYEQNWKKNVETYTQFLSHLKETLESAREQYQALYQRAKGLKPF